jgi:hypothetical protein
MKFIRIDGLAKFKNIKSEVIFSDKLKYVNSNFPTFKETYYSCIEIEIFRKVIKKLKKKTL